MKQLIEHIPDFICDEGDTTHVIYSDTDSIYVHAHPLLKHRHPNFDELENGEKDKLLEDVALDFQDKITNYYDVIAKDVFNRD